MGRLPLSLFLPETTRPSADHSQMRERGERSSLCAPLNPPPPHPGALSSLGLFRDFILTLQAGHSSVTTLSLPQAALIFPSLGPMASFRIHHSAACLVEAPFTICEFWQIHVCQTHTVP